MLNDLKLPLQYILPKLWSTHLAGWDASKCAGWLTKLVINLFAKCYKVDMKEAQKPDTVAYRAFNDFFVCPLRDSARPLNTDPNALVMPADGVISQLDVTEGDKILQAKGRDHSLKALLVGNYQMVGLFHSDSFATTYLSPRDYHRVYIPCNGVLREMIYVPSDLSLVNYLTVQSVPNLLAHNKHIVCLLGTEFGPMAQILVGATIVGSIEAVRPDTVTPPREGIIKRWTWLAGDSEGPVALLKGQKIGRSKLGLTVVNLLTSGQVKLIDPLQSLSVTKIGRPLTTAVEVSTAAESAPLPGEKIRIEHRVDPLVNDTQGQG